LALLLDIPLERKKDLIGLIVLSQLSSVLIALHVRQWTHVHAPTQHKYIHPKRKKEKEKPETNRETRNSS
jgi:hypothetical protein